MRWEAGSEGRRQRGAEPKQLRGPTVKLAMMMSSRKENRRPRSRRGFKQGSTPASRKKQVFLTRLDRAWSKFMGQIRKLSLESADRRRVLETAQQGLEWLASEAASGEWSTRAPSEGFSSVAGGKFRVAPKAAVAQGAAALASASKRAGVSTLASKLDAAATGAESKTVAQTKPVLPAVQTMAKAAKRKETASDIVRRFREHLYRKSMTLREMYRSIDANHSNRLSFHEIWRSLESFNLAEGAAKHLVHNLARDYMRTNPGSMTYQEFAAFMNSHAVPTADTHSWRIPQNRREFLQAIEKMRNAGKYLRAVYRKMDTDNDNLLSFKELCNYLQRSNVPTEIVEDPRFAEYVSGYMLTHLGYMTYSEFLVFVQQSKPPRKGCWLMEVNDDRKWTVAAILKDVQSRIDGSCRRLHASFKHFDSDGNGALGPSEFFHALGDLNVRVSPSVVDTLFRAVDANSDGQVQYNELVRALGSADAVMREPAMAPAGLATPSRRGKGSSMRETMTDNWVAPSATATADTTATADDNTTATVAPPPAQQPETAAPVRRRPVSRQTESSFTPSGQWRQDVEKKRPMSARKHKSNYAHANKESINLFQGAAPVSREVLAEDERILAEISRVVYSASTSGLRVMFKKMCTVPRYLSWPDFKSSMKRFGLKFPEDALQRIFQKHDTNQDGRLGYSEFVRMLAERTSPKKM